MRDEDRKLGSRPVLRHIRLNPMASELLETERIEERPLISSASILILSAFLAGAGFAGALPRSGQIHAVFAAAAGVAAYLGLWYTTRLQERLAATREELRTARKLERRLGKHVPVRKSAVTGVVRRIGPSRG